MIADANRPYLSKAGFKTTIWSVVLSARDLRNGEQAGALEQLCQTYWPAIYGFLRRNGQAPADAEDLTQGFLSSLLARSSFESVSPDRGRFRAFLKSALRHYLADQRDRNTALKRGGGRDVVSLDAETAEAFYARQSASEETPETLFERQWAETIFRRAQNRLRDECEAADRRRLFDEIGPLRAAHRAESDAAIAARHGMSENAVRVAAFRLRQRYQELVREEIAQTVTSNEELEEEIRHLIRLYECG